MCRLFLRVQIYWRWVGKKNSFFFFFFFRFYLPPTENEAKYFQNNCWDKSILIEKTLKLVKSQKAKKKYIWKLQSHKTNNRNDKRFNNCAYLLFYLMAIFLKHLRLIPNILKWQDCKIFTKLVPLQTPFQK